jgi:hypothetical protein
MADINLPFLPSPNSDPLYFLNLHIERSHSVKIQGQKVRYWCILCFHRQKAFNSHTNCHCLWFVTFSNQFYLLIFIWKNHTIINCPWKTTQQN